MQATLILSDGTALSGQSFGYEADAQGEVVFCTAMTGYTESLTDPSYAGQILVLTYPLVGNYGVPPCGEAGRLPRLWESDRIHARGLIVADYCQDYSHWNASESLSHWLKREHIPAITGIDTRRLTEHLREKGVMMGQIVCGNVPSLSATPPASYDATNWVETVSTHEVVTYLPSPSEKAGETPARKRVLLVDCGAKANIIRCLLSRGVEVIRVPWNFDYTGMDFDGILLSNGPGDPNTLEAAVEVLRRQMNSSDKPIFGICLGNQLLAKAAGADIYKLKYGHRSHNQPVRLVGQNRCYITAQNHGYAVDDTTLPKGWEPLFVNMNDGSNEGIRHQSKPWFSVQFHPEACSGPTDTEFLFDDFLSSLGRNRD